ncbi:hypothetical protein LR48_Vigan08g035200 [Vigna angularis]|uniref:Uncharacterized protein n=1 Tax=Phaseolus angularis TaxID=3914 RepID=A0A0L9V398_PHAAN|nr:hypothetical protein LR48_Vigan08g035200 [Vigna angularis]
MSVKLNVGGEAQRGRSEGVLQRCRFHEGSKLQFLSSPFLAGNQPGKIIDGTAMSARARGWRGKSAMKARHSLRGGVCCDDNFSRSRGGSCDDPQRNHEGGRRLGANGDDW